MDDSDLLELLSEAARSGARRRWPALATGGRTGTVPASTGSTSWPTPRPSAVLHDAGLAVLVRGVGPHRPGGTSSQRPKRRPADELLVVVDPVDGSTNASLGIPWYATSLCVLDAEGPRAALVVNQASGVRYEAVRGQGRSARRAYRSPPPAVELGQGGGRDLGVPRPRPRLGPVPGAGIGGAGPLRRRRGRARRLPRVRRRRGSTAGTTWGACSSAPRLAVRAGELRGDDLVVRDASPRRPAAAATPELLESLLSFEE